MKIYGCYEKGHFNSLPLEKGSHLAVEVSIAWAENCFRRKSDKNYRLRVRSGCFFLDIKAKNGDFLSKDKATGLLKKIISEDIVFLDDEGVSFFAIYDTTPDAYQIRNSVDDVDYDDIPIKVVVVKEE